MGISLFIFLTLVFLLMIVLFADLVLYLSQILDFINDQIIEPCRKFADKNEGFFSVLFIIVFALEQALLIWFTTYFNENTTWLRLIISIFALVVITTAALQRFVLETKRRYENERYYTIKRAKDLFLKVKKELNGNNNLEKKKSI